MKPKLIIFTTPNYKFNILFKSCKYENGYRHDDHKFEWTQEQFQDWSLNLCQQYPDYNVAFYDIGPGPPDTEHYGCVSQMAVFVRNDFLIEKLGAEENFKLVTNTVQTCAESVTPTLIPFKQPLPPLVKLLDYEKIFTHTYPIYIDDRSREQKILNECQFHIGRFMSMDEEYFSCERYLYLIPVTDLFKYVQNETDSIREIRAVLLKNGYKINKEDILEVEPEDTSSNSEYEEQFDDGQEKENNCPMEVEHQKKVEEDENWS